MQKDIKSLEFDKIQDMLAEHAKSDLGRLKIRKLRLANKPYLVRQMLTETSEGVSVISHKGAFPITEYVDVRMSAVHAKKGGVLTPAQLKQTAKLLAMSRQVKQFIESFNIELAQGNTKPLSRLLEYTSVLSGELDIEKAIDRSIIADNEISDDASKELRDIRRNMKLMHDRIKTKLEHFTRSNSYSDILRERIYTMRDGRYVLPVKIEYLNKFPGIVHDKSKTGTTVFIEPQAILALDSELRELEIAERREIERILTVLSARIGEIEHDISMDVEIISDLDMISAKATLALRMDATMPIISEEKIIDIKAGRHPLIDPLKVVPITLTLGKNYKSLIITGPNTGGKTVTLKTVGLFLLMMKAGLFVPAESGTTLPIIRYIKSDIGDEQSIEQSLSTFSSHMTNIVSILKNADKDAICFLDELGAGTDPAEGAALGVSILEELAKRGALVMATTHYTELKKYALATDGVENASMEFNVETLSPTYKLRVGAIGRSNAFDISLRLGLDAAIIERAASHLDEDALEFDEVIGSIERDKDLAQRERDEALDLRLRMEDRERQLLDKLQDADKQAEAITAKAEAQAKKILEDAGIYADIIKEDLKEIYENAESRANSRGDDLRRIDEAKKNLRKVRQQTRLDEAQFKDVDIGNYKLHIAPSEPHKDTRESIRAEDLKAGDRVRVKSLDQIAVVVKAPRVSAHVTGNNDQYDPDIELQVGIMKLKKKLSDLSRIEGEKREGAPSKSSIRAKEVRNIKRNSGSTIMKDKRGSVRTEIDVRGLDLDEALRRVSKYVDDVYLSGLENVTIIHGRGTGILKQGISEYLKGSNVVDSFRRGGPGEGGDGVTVVSVKNE
ncbi:MAG: endonuclease MutS2 [Clostridiales Family XIII bacterium]|jgi:DNA mismatch repair protein MutS2|nr:endonuclease MutS2 [Clostridiales Family XIII bacterium]